MAEPRTINCEDCGVEVETTRRNTKYCSVCRLIQDLPFVAGQLRICGLCENDYAPLDRHDLLCGECAPGYRKHQVECAFCHETKPAARLNISVCTGCAREPELRKKLWASLKRRQETQEQASVC